MELVNAKTTLQGINAILAKKDTSSFLTVKVNLIDIFIILNCKLRKINISKTVVCECDQDGTMNCNHDGTCECKDNIEGDKCNSCKEGYFKFPDCEGNSY